MTSHDTTRTDTTWIDTSRTDTAADRPIPEVPAADLDLLRTQVRGAVLAPGEPAYLDAVAGWNRAAAHSPAVAVLAADAADVVRAVHFARRHGLGVGIVGTGHGAVRSIDGVMVVTRELQELTVDPATRTARVGAGVRMGALLAAAQERGLAPLIGSSVTVGVVGFHLGGGLSWLSRKYGPACDLVRAVELVTPEGELVRATAHEHPELFRALRGGGGGALGVVTALEIELVPLTTVYAGSLFYPADAAAEVAGRFAGWVTDAPDELTSALMFMNFPPLPDVPEPLRGQSFLIVRGCWSGDLDEGRRLVDAWRALAPPMIDMWDQMDFADAAAISNDPVDPMPFSDTGGWLTSFDATTAAAIAAHTFPAGGPPPVMFTEVRHAGGAVARNDRSRSAMGNRDGQFLFHTIAIPMDPTAGLATTPGQQALLDALGDRVSEHSYLNFVDGEERRRRTAAAVDAGARAGLAALQAELDPHDLLRYGVDHRG